MPHDAGVPAPRAMNDLTTCNGGDLLRLPYRSLAMTTGITWSAVDLDRSLKAHLEETV